VVGGELDIKWLKMLESIIWAHPEEAKVLGI
jgi:hypothetical protein